VFTYEQFVNEIRALLNEGKNLRGAQKRDQDPSFRKWRLKLQDNIRRIKDQGFEVNCKSKYRNYGASSDEYFGSSSDALNSLYNRELEDTLNELNLIVENFDKYGPPKIKVSSGCEVENGHIPTIKELYLALSVHHGWKTIAAILAVIGLMLFGAYKVGQFVERNIYSTQKENNKEPVNVDKTSNNSTQIAAARLGRRKQRAAAHARRYVL